MSYWKIKLSLFFNYFIFAILLNSVGVVILQVINDFGVNPESASVLEAYKDLSIALASFLLASYIPRFGYKRAMLAGLAVVTLGSILMRVVPGFAMSQILFAMVGISFALIKVSVYSTVSLITDNSNDHASFMSILEGIFMVGVLSGFWIFGIFIDLGNTYESITWLDSYWVLALISALAFLLMFVTDLDESDVNTKDQSPKEDFFDMIALVKYPLVLLFITSAFLYVYIEQALNTWLPTFNFQILQLPDAMSVQVTSIYAASLAGGRIIGGWIMKKIHWFYVLTTCLAFAGGLFILVLPLASNIEPGSVTGWSTVPVAAFIIPLIGLFLAPVYPTLSSTILSAMPKRRQSGMTGLIVIFSALGGTSGSIITGILFGRLDGQIAFYFTLIPLFALLFVLFPYKKLRQKFDIQNANSNENSIR